MTDYETKTTKTDTSVTVPESVLRDWFASQVECHAEIYLNGDWTLDHWNRDILEELMGSAIPELAGERLKWFAEAEAMIRYAKADAMLKQRNIV